MSLYKYGIDNINFVRYNIGMETKNDNTQVAETKVATQPKANEKKLRYKTPLTPYQKYKQSKNQNGKKYFEFYDDIKVYTHNVYDW